MAFGIRGRGLDICAIFREGCLWTNSHGDSQLQRGGGPQDPCSLSLHEVLTVGPKASPETSHRPRSKSWPMPKGCPVLTPHHVLSASGLGMPTGCSVRSLGPCGPSAWFLLVAPGEGSGHELVKW